MPPEALETRRRVWMLQVFGRLARMATRAGDGEVPSPEDMRRALLELLAEYPDAPAS